MLKDIAIYGAGGFGKEVACLIDVLNKSKSGKQWNFLGFFDDGKAVGTKISHFGYVLGGISELNTWPEPINISIAIGDPTTLEKVRNSIINPKIEFPNLVDPTFYMSDPSTFSMGHGNIIQGCCCVSPDVSIGNFNVLNGWVVIGHDSNIGDFNSFMPGTRISGEVSIGNRNLFGVQSIVIQQIRVGHDVILGAGSVQMTKPKDNCLYIGVPAKRFKF